MFQNGLIFQTDNPLKQIKALSFKGELKFADIQNMISCLTLNTEIDMDELYNEYTIAKLI